MKQRTFRINVQYITSYGHLTAIGSWADTMKQAIGYCKWYASEIKHVGGRLIKSEASICGPYGIELKTVTVHKETDHEEHQQPAL
jgi:hypothetical protein